MGHLVSSTEAFSLSGGAQEWRRGKFASRTKPPSNLVPRDFQFQKEKPWGQDWQHYIQTKWSVPVKVTTIISWVRREKVWSPGFNVKTTVLSGATCLFPMVTVSAAVRRLLWKPAKFWKRDKRPRPVLVCCFARFAAYDVKGRQVTTGYGASCL